ncbi:hypothetical protein [Burkholderia plantarii]|uniref:hypothetical protein n=1 Tax=Burkholderia plantarii TaxID=41899 RepID=UPI000A78735B|nr:hypothetical protein Bpla01_63940 [Burkholderia plantarii]
MKTEHFKAVDAAGNSYDVIVKRRELSPGPPPVYGIPEFKLLDGGSLVLAGRGLRKLKILQTGVVITII